MTLQELSDYAASGQPIEGVYQPARDLILQGGIFRVDNSEYRTVPELQNFLTRFFQVDGLLFDGNTLIGIANGVSISTPPRVTQSVGGIGGPPVHVPTRPQSRTLSFMVSAPLDIARSYHLVDNQGAVHRIIGGHFEFAGGTTSVVTNIP